MVVVVVVDVVVVVVGVVVVDVVVVVGDVVVDVVVVVDVIVVGFPVVGAMKIRKRHLDPYHTQCKKLLKPLYNLLMHQQIKCCGRSFIFSD